MQGVKQINWAFGDWPVCSRGTIILVFVVVAISEQGQFVNNTAGDIIAFILGMLSLGCGLYLIIKDATSD